MTAPKEVTFKIVRDKEWDGYVVQYLEDGVVNKAKSYHTDSEIDAVDTLTAMKDELEVQQHARLDRIGNSLMFTLIKRKLRD